MRIIVDCPRTDCSHGVSSARLVWLDAVPVAYVPACGHILPVMAE